MAGPPRLSVSSMSAAMPLAVARHVRYIQRLDTVRRPCPARARGHVPR